MKGISIFAQQNMVASKKNDMGLIISIILLLGFGLVTLYISADSYALKVFHDSNYFIKRQLMSILFGFIAMIFVICIDLDFIRKCLPVIVIGTLFLCILTLLPGISDNRNGASRWIKLPFKQTFQPSELAKIAVVLFLANLFAKKYDRLDEPNVSVIPAFIGLLSFVLIIFAQKDFSTSIFILFIGLIMFFIAGVSLKWFLTFGIFTIPLALIFIFSETYRVKRVIAFLCPGFDVTGINYQLAASQRAISTGGIWGEGISSGIKQVTRIPEVQADFIFAGWCEAMGFIGVIIFFIILCYFLWRAISIALECTDRFRSLTAFGVSLVIFVQSVMNCGVVSGALPSTGIALPFFSAGGSSILVTMILCGFLINISHYNKKSEMVYE